MTESKPKLGRPTHQPTAQSRGLVEVAAAGGIQQDEIAKALGISDETLRKYYRDELDGGMARANTRVVANMFRQAVKDDFKAFPFVRLWAENRMGWKRKHDVNIAAYDLTKIADADLNKLEAILGTAVADADGDPGGEGAAGE